MLFLAPALVSAVTFLAALVPPIHIGSQPPKPVGPQYPAPEGYLLPWAGGEIHLVTQGENTSFTHNGLAAYAFDFDLSYETIVAARGGRVSLVRADSNSGGCSAIYSSATNYVVIDHGDGTSAAYLHLAYGAVMVHPGDVVEQGQPIAVSGETGVTCGGSGGPGPHLHFQVERTEDGRYFTQSVPIAFDDISDSDGVAQEGRMYVSGNYGSGKPQKIALTPHRVPRDFHPAPPNPHLPEGDPAPVIAWPTPTAGPQLALPVLPALPSPSPSAPAKTVTDVPQGTPTPEPSFTPTIRSGSPTPAPSTPTVASAATQVASPTPTPTPTVTATPLPTTPTAPSGGGGPPPG